MEPMIIYKQEVQRRQRLQKAEVSFKFNQWKMGKMGELCRIIKEWRVENLSIQNTDQTNGCCFLKEIKQIVFPCLTTINISNNHLESIQVLSQIFLPLLQDLQLKQNDITKIRTLVKGNWLNLENIELERNPVNDGEKLTTLGSKKLKSLKVHSFLQEKYYEVSNFCKIETPVLEGIQLKAQWMIEQEKVEEAMKRKYTNLAIEQENFCSIQ